MGQEMQSSISLQRRRWQWQILQSRIEGKEQSLDDPEGYSPGGLQSALQEEVDLGIMRDGE